MKKMTLLAVLTSVSLAVVGLIMMEPRLGIDANQGFIWGNAMQVAYPEYQVIHRGFADTEQNFFRARTRIEIDTHANSINFANVRDSQVITQNLFGVVGFPRLRDTPMTSYLSNFRGGTPVAAEEKSRAIEQVNEIPADQKLIVLVELASPMEEASLPVHFDNGQWKRFFLSGGQPHSGKPIYWWPGWGGCTALALRDQNCGARSVIADYRKWVSRFTDDDSRNLKKIGLDLFDLRKAADMGKVYGFIHTVEGRADLLALLKKTDVRMVKVVEVVPPVDDPFQ